MTTTRVFRLPDLGEGLTESEVVEWRVAVGDTVELNQVIAEVETAKAIVDLPSPVAGVVQALHADAGETVDVGEPLVTFELPADELSVSPRGIPGAESDNSTASELSGPAREIPRGESDNSGEESPGEPNLVGYGARPERQGRPRRRPRRYADAAAAATLAPAPAAGERPRSTPVVRTLARQRGIDLASVAGSGPHGRVTRADVEAAVPAPESSSNGATETRTPVRSVRKHTAAAMVDSVRTAPQASVFLTVDVTRSMELLERLRDHPRTRGTRVTVLALVARALCVLLPDHPSLTSRWEDLPDGGAEIVRPAHVNLGIAVATDRGLVVPHVPAADTMALPDLAAALGDLVTTARAGRTAPERLSGGTLTITNVGVFGVDAGTPILNPGEPAILGLGQVVRRPWEHDGQVALRQVTTLSLTFDHRVVDGEQGARFLADLGGLLADPALALLHGGDVTTEGGAA
ncbi:dihydrolipoamide acetyltransferase family protein [Isoptericola sp. BMS4]|uniref:dihydrolipoamide acetyltransferase family protein n=1 Tax=Isoptericola sp. BMS4 TaxID=2527875 RepID=UPI00141E9A83|nr:dihydrolipoamide acetyltransferase family protein [Isoptericola sp. BMS4]